MPDFYVGPSDRDIEEIAHSAGVQDAVVINTEAGIDHAQSIAPVLTGEYASSFRVEVVGEEIHLVNDAGHAAAVEWGAHGTDAHHVLSNTADWIEAETSQ